MKSVQRRGSTGNWRGEGYYLPFESVHSWNSDQLSPRFVSAHLITSSFLVSDSLPSFCALSSSCQDRDAKERGSNEWYRRKKRMSLPLQKHDRAIRVEKGRRVFILFFFGFNISAQFVFH